jgi:hypothetical protein
MAFAFALIEGRRLLAACGRLTADPALAEQRAILAAMA